MTTTATSNGFTAARDLLRDLATNHRVMDRRYDPLARWSDAAGRSLGWVEAAMFVALSAPVPDDAFDVDPDAPLLRWADPDVAAVSLLDAILDPPNHKAKTCDRCTGSLRRMKAYRLWLPCGQSAVELQVCGMCFDIANDLYRADPDLGGPAGRALVWR